MTSIHDDKDVLLEASVDGISVAPPDFDRSTTNTFYSLLDRLDDGVLLLRAEHIAYANSAAAALMGVHASILIGKPLSEFVTNMNKEKGDGDPRHTSVPAAVRTTRLKRADAPPLEVEVRSCSDPNHTGETLLLLKPIPLKAHPTLSPFHMHMDALPLGIMRIDRQLRYLYGNAVLRKTAPAFFAQAQPGEKLHELGWPTGLCTVIATAVKEMVKDPVARCLPITVEAGEDVRLCLAEFVPECSARGKLQSVLVLLREADGQSHELQETHRLLEREREECEKAQTATQALERLIGIVSHELRGPLNGIQTWAHILESYSDTFSAAPLAQRALQGIRTGVNQQAKLIEDLLDMSRLLNGKIALSNASFSLLQAIQEAVENAHPCARDKGILLTCHYQVTDEEMKGDFCRVQQLISALVLHAVADAPRGSHIRMSAQACDGQAMLRVEQIEARFPTQGDSKTGERSPSNSEGLPAERSAFGWDLFLAGRAAQLQGGQVRVEQEACGKKVFAMTLPLQPLSK